MGHGALGIGHWALGMGIRACFQAIDIIKDFNRTGGDKIQIIARSFGATSLNQFSYKSSTGGLFFDASPSDNVNPLQLATIENKPAGFSTQLDIVLV
jgi:hypothetical protein